MTLSLEEHMTNLEVFIGDAEHFELADDSTVDITEAYNAFKAMVEEIGRLKAERDDWKGCVGALKTIKDAKEESLRTLNAELREAALPFAAHDWYDAELEDDNCKLTRHSGPVTVGHWRALRAILAKSQEAAS